MTRQAWLTKIPTMALSHRSPSEHDLDLLSAYLDGALSDREREALERRLHDDPALQVALADLRQSVALLRSLPRLKAPRSFALDPALYGRQARRSFKLSWAAVMQLSGAIGVAASVILIAAIWIAGGSQRTITPAADVATGAAVASVPTETIVAETAIAYAGDDLLQSTIAAQAHYYATLEAAPSPAPGWETGGVAGNSGAQVAEAESTTMEGGPPAPAAAPGANALEGPFGAPDAAPQDAAVFGAAAAPAAAGPVAAEVSAAQPQDAAPAPLTLGAAPEEEPAQAQREADSVAQASPTPALVPTALADGAVLMAPSAPEPLATPVEALAEPPQPATKQHTEPAARREIDWPWIALAALLGMLSLALLVAGTRRSRRL